MLQLIWALFCGGGGRGDPVERDVRDMQRVLQLERHQQLIVNERTPGQRLVDFESRRRQRAEREKRKTIPRAGASEDGSESDDSTSNSDVERDEDDDERARLVRDDDEEDDEEANVEEKDDDVKRSGRQEWSDSEVESESKDGVGELPASRDRLPSSSSEPTAPKKASKPISVALHRFDIGTYSSHPDSTTSIKTYFYHRRCELTFARKAAKQSYGQMVFSWDAIDGISIAGTDKVSLLTLLL